MFGRKPKPVEETPAEEATSPVDPTGAKGRPTPTRREAEAARKQNLRIPKDPKEAKKAAREREREERAKSRAAMMAGDERYLPARDKGPAKAFTRDFVDSRFTLAEYFIFFAIIVLVLGFVRNQFIQTWVSVAFFAVTALIAVDTIVLVLQLRSRAKKEFPNAADRKGISLYAVLRTLQLRRLRLPPPRVRRGGMPVVPKS
jgi:Flp pilus assembly protein TadB